MKQNNYRIFVSKSEEKMGRKDACKCTFEEKNEEKEDT